MEQNELRQTGAIWIPKIPKHWELIKVRHLFKESTIKGFPNEPLLVASQEHGVVNKDVFGKRTMEATKDFHLLKFVEKGDFVISLRSFQGGIELAHERGIISPAYTILKAKRQVDKRYFKHLFKSKPFISLMTLCVKGIRDGQNIDFPTFKGEYLPLPPLEEQKKIGLYLDRKTQQIQEFIAKKDRLIELLEEEKNNIINIAITKGISNTNNFYNSQIEWIGLIPSHWKIKRLRFLGTCQNGISAPGDKFGKGSPFVSYSHVYKNLSLPEEVEDLIESNATERKAYSVKEGDVFFTRTSETIEEIGFASTCLKTIEDAVFAGFLIRFRPKKNVLFPRFSKYYFRSTLHRAYFNQEVDLVTRVSLGQDLLKSLPILLPPMHEQEEIANFIELELHKRNLLLSKAQTEIEKAKEYQESLITQMVTGQLKVPELASARLEKNITLGMVAEPNEHYGSLN